MDSLKEKGKWNGEVLHTHKNGEKLYMLLSITVISGDPKSFTTVTIGKNITQHKKDTQKLSLYGTMLENSNDAIITLNSELVITSWNNGAGRVYGYSASEAIGQFEPDFLPVDPQSAYDIANEIKDYGDDRNGKYFRPHFHYIGSKSPYRFKRLCLFCYGYNYKKESIGRQFQAYRNIEFHR